MCWLLVGWWSLTSVFSTNTAVSEMSADSCHSGRHSCGDSVLWCLVAKLLLRHLQRVIFECIGLLYWCLNALYKHFCIVTSDFYSAPQCSHCKCCISYGNSVRLSVRLSVTSRYCAKTTARSTVQFARSDSKMCLVLYKAKNIPQGQPLPPEILARTDLSPPDSSESWHLLPRSVSTVRHRKRSPLHLTRTRHGLSNEPSTKVLRHP